MQYLFDYLKRSGYKIEYDLADIVRQLTLLRVLKPASKMKSCEKLSHRYMTGFDMEKTQAYRCLDVLDECKEDVVRILNSRLGKLIPERKTSVCLYDITTFAFESTDVDTLRDFGYSKDQKFNDVQVVMALGADGDGIPLDFSLFNGCQAEVSTMIPFIDRLSKSYGCKKFTIVADRGLNCNGNVDSLLKLGHDVVLAFKIGSASENLKKLALSEEGRKPLLEKGKDGKIRQYGWYKEITSEVDLNYRYPNFAFEKLTGDDLEEARKKLKETLLDDPKRKGVKSKRQLRFLITYTDRRAKKDKAALDKLIDKANKLIANPSDYDSQIKRGGRCLIKEVDVNDEKLEKKLQLDEDLIAEKKKLLGIHVIETSLKGDAARILKIYKQLWRIEDDFRTLKTPISSRPVFVRTEGHVRGHFLLCYMALVIIRYLEFLLRNSGTTHGIDCVIDSLNQMKIEEISPFGIQSMYSFRKFTKIQKALFEVARLGVPGYYEWGAAVRALLRLNRKTTYYFHGEDEKKAS